MKNKIELYNNKEWEVFIIENILNVSGTVTTHPSLLKVNGYTPRITCAATNNGLENLYKNNPTEKGGVLTIDSATIGYVSYHPYDFIATDHVEKVSFLDNTKINLGIGLFLVRAINKATDSKYGYGYKFSQTRIKRQRVLLPAKFSKPDFEYMETYIEQVQNRKEKIYLDFISKRVDDLKGINKPSLLKDKVWDSFYIEDVADIISGRDIYEAERINGELPYISSTANNNGIGYFVGNNNLTLEKECLSVNRNGSVGYSFYHPYNALFSNDCRKLRPKFKSRYVGLFLSNQITQQKDKYGYGYKMGTARLKKQKIMLPINIKGEPDYKYMEQYMKYIEYVKLSAYIKFKKKKSI